jgi:hypothetical protein
MLVNTPHRVATAVGMAVALVLVGLHARACSVHRDVAAQPIAACAVAADPAVAPTAAPGAAEPASHAEPDSDEDAAIPSITHPCITDTTELLADAGYAVLCWGQRCLGQPRSLASTVARPAAAAEPVVDDGRVCTGTRCDRVGPRLGAAIAGMTDPTIAATRDHASIVLTDNVPGDPARIEAWNRAADRPIDLGAPDEDDGAIAYITVLGDVLIVTRECMSKGCTAVSRVIDARGRRRGDVSEPDAPLESDQTTQATVVALDADHRVVRDSFDEVVMIDHGRVTAAASLLGEQLARLDDHTFAVLSCSGDDAEAACHLIVRQVEEPQPGSPGVEITTIDDTRLPRCPRD